MHCASPKSKIGTLKTVRLHQKRRGQFGAVNWGLFAPQNWGLFGPVKWGLFDPVKWGLFVWNFQPLKVTLRISLTL
jgi:hypothetical protein